VIGLPNPGFDISTRIVIRVGPFTGLKNILDEPVDEFDTDVIGQVRNSAPAAIESS
jgi:hypothetical protein